MPLNEHQLEEFNYNWDAYLFLNPSKRPPNYQVPDEEMIRIYDDRYKGPREITYEYQDQYFKDFVHLHLDENKNYNMMLICFGIQVNVLPIIVCLRNI
jgi:hypothetical protein